MISFRHIASQSFLASALAGAIGCTNRSQDIASQDTRLRVADIVAPADTAPIARVAFDTLPTHIAIRDRLTPGPSTRIVLRDSLFLPDAWRAVGAQGRPPVVDFKKNTVVLIGTDTYGGGNMDVAVDSVFSVGRKLYVIVQEYSNGKMTDVSSRGTLALLVPGVFPSEAVTFIGRPVIDRF
jgi:hypothetical protein